MKQFLYSLLGLIIHTAVLAQTAQITFKFPADSSNFTVNLTAEKVAYTPSPAIGLTPEQYFNVGSFEVKNQRTAMTEFEVKEPQIVNLDIAPLFPKAMAWSSKSANFGSLLYISPNDKLTIIVRPDGQISYEGTNAHYQTFLRDYFKSNFYDYLPLFGYKPTQIDNSAILPKVDSLKAARQKGLENLKSTQVVSQTFNTLINASTTTEDYLMKIIVSDKKIRESQGVQLKREQRQEIESLVLQNFRLLDDDALLSRAYRNELRTFLQIPVTQKYTPNADKGYILSQEAVQYAYQMSDEKLQSYPRHRAYMLTHWLDYAVTNQQDMSAAKALLVNYEKTYPSSELIGYFNNMITAKEKMYVAQPAPAFTFKNQEGQAVSLSSLSGKPVCIAFCFNLKQHEYNFKPLEEAYRDRMTFLYLNVTPNTPFDVWKTTVATRPGVVHLWASDEDTKVLRDTYVPTMQYPFVLIDAMGKIVQRWIPQEFPDNKTLQEELRNLVRK